MRFIKATYHESTKTVEYESPDGSRLLKTGGTLNWRFNNPGNIISAGNQPGKIGVGIVHNPNENKFSIFSSMEMGESAKRILLKRKYGSFTVPEMMKKYAPEDDHNDPVAYANYIMKESGVTKDQKVGDLDDEHFDKVVNAISKQEGGLKPGTERWVYVTKVTVSDGARPVAEVPFSIVLGNKTYNWKTDSLGRLTTIIHTEIGMPIAIKYTDSSGKETIVHSESAGEKTRNILLTRNFSKFSANTLVDKPKKTREKSLQKPIEYTVMSGDTLSKIAGRYKTSVEEITRNNNIKNSDEIFPGQLFTIYGDSKEKSSTYQVKPGDTLARIAKVHGISVDDLASDNGISNPDRINPGQVLIINDGENRTGNDKTSKVKQKAINTDEIKLESIGGKNSGTPLAILPHDQKEAPWMVIAIREAEIWKGSDESIITKKSNYHKLIGVGLGSLRGSNNAWCASFVNYCLQESGYRKSTYPMRARSFMNDNINFFKISTPVYGALATSGYHVTFVYGLSKGGKSIIGLGGNQGGGSIINGSVSGGTIKFSVYTNMQYYLPVAYKTYYEKTKKIELQEFDVNELNSVFLNMIVKVKGKEGTR